LASAEHALTVLSACEPVAATAFSWEPLTPTAGQVLTFTASASGTEPITYSWQFGNSDFEMGNPSTHTFTMAGMYTVTLTATNACGSEVLTTSLTVLPPPCQPVTLSTFSWVPLTPTAGQVLTFTASASGTEPISYSWALEDGSTAAGAVVTHTYALSGTYSVTVTASNACGEAWISREIVVVGP